jgi:hypothetical protein
MSIMARQRLSASAVAVAIGLVLHGVAAVEAQADDQGVLTGLVARCVNGAEQPAGQVAVGIEGGGGSLARTDSSGQFLLALPPGMYTVIATASDGTAARQYVPVEAGQSLDIGIIDIGGGVAGCGPDSEITAPVLPTFTATPEPPAPTATPIPVPTATPVPVPTPEPTIDPSMEEPPADPATGG